METALTGDVAILRAWKADEAGNCVFRYAPIPSPATPQPNSNSRYTTRAFGPIMAKAATLTIVEAENIVPVGALDPNEVHLPGIFVDRVVPATEEKTIELLKLREDESDASDASSSSSSRTAAQERRDRIARRTAQELKQGYYVNLGVGKKMTALVLVGALV